MKSRFIKNIIKYTAYIIGVFALIIKPLDIINYYSLYSGLIGIYFSPWQFYMILAVQIIIWSALLYCLYKKRYIIVILLALFELFFISDILYKVSPLYKIVIDEDICADANYCVEGSRDGISEENCLENNGAWNIDDNACQYYFDLKNCFKLEGLWLYPNVCDRENKG